MRQLPCILVLSSLAFAGCTRPPEQTSSALEHIKTTQEALAFSSYPYFASTKWSYLDSQHAEFTGDILLEKLTAQQVADGLLLENGPDGTAVQRAENFLTNTRRHLKTIELVLRFATAPDRTPRVESGQFNLLGPNGETMTVPMSPEELAIAQQDIGREAFPSFITGFLLSNMHHN